jgi:hypothetical protein
MRIFAYRPFSPHLKVHGMEMRAGGGYRVPFMNSLTGHRHSLGGDYPELMVTAA